MINASKRKVNVFNEYHNVSTRNFWYSKLTHSGEYIPKKRYLYNEKNL